MPSLYVGIMTRTFDQEEKGNPSMKAMSIVLAVLVSTTSIGIAQAKEKADAVGRYAITFSPRGLYFLDTATGLLWLKSGGSDWKRVDSPVASAPEDGPADKPVLLELSKDGVIMPMLQRERRHIPGSSETISVRLGDITAGQVFVEVVDINGRHLVERTSLRNDEFTHFTLNGKTVYLHIDEMVNNLIGDDMCKVRVSSTEPRTEAEKEAPPQEETD
jgi:hypothetical protein